MSQMRLDKFSDMKVSMLYPGKYERHKYVYSGPRFMVNDVLTIFWSNILDVFIVEILTASKMNSPFWLVCVFSSFVSFRALISKVTSMFIAGIP